MLHVLIRAQHVAVEKPERVAEALGASAFGSWLFNQLTAINVVLETITLTLGVMAGVFALFFQYRKWKNERTKRADEVAKKVLDELRKDGIIEDKE